MMKDYFEVLDIGEDTSEQAINDAYRQMLVKYPAGRYPEKNNEIEEAYRMLCDPAARKSCIEFHRMEQPSKEAYKLASTALTEGRYAEAAQILETAVEHEKHTIHLNYLLGIIYLNLKKPYKAFKALQPVSDAYPGDVDLNTFYIKACLDSHKYKKAVKRAEECLARGSDNYMLIHLLTEGYLQLGQYEYAIALLEDSFNNPALEDNRHNICAKLTYIYFLDENIDECFKWMDKLTGLPASDEDKEDSVQLIIEILDRFIDVHMLQQARKCIDTILELTPYKEDVEEFKRNIDALMKIKPEIDSFEGDKFIPDFLKIYVANGVFNNWIQNLSEEKQKAYSVLLDYQILNENIDILMALRYMKNKYPQLYQLKADFFDALQDTRERKKLTNRNKALFYQYHDLIRELMDEFDDEDNDIDNDGSFDADGDDDWDDDGYQDEGGKWGEEGWDDDWDDDEDDDWGENEDDEWDEYEDDDDYDDYDEDEDDEWDEDEDVRDDDAGEDDNE